MLSIESYLVAHTVFCCTLNYSCNNLLTRYHISGVELSVFLDSIKILAKTQLNKSVVYVQSISPTEAEVVAADVLFASGADDRWSVLEEDMLLDAVEHHGFGSWFCLLYTSPSPRDQA